MKLENNGWKSKGEKSKHIDIRYFFIGDVLKREKVELMHCKTDKMVADYFTKPLQGGLFRKLRNYIMGITAIPFEERVEKDKKPDKENIANGTTVKSNVKKGTYAEIVKGNM